jgi:NADH-quinone oxidoreductase subunit C
VSVDEAAAPADATCQRYLDALRAEFGDKVLGAEITKTDLIVRIDRSVWVDTAKFCKAKLGLRFFCFLSGLDWLASDVQATRYENIWGSVDDEGDVAEGGAAEASEADAPAEAAPAGFVTGKAGGDTRFQVFARYSSPTEHRGVIVKADLDDADPRVPTLSTVFGGADWHERETSEMFGFGFDGHPNLVHIYLPGAFEGYPLRKDFPLLAREVKPWPGLTNVEPIAGEGNEEGEG